MLLSYMYDQTDNLKGSKYFSLFVLFHLNIKDKRRMLVPKSRENKLKKLMAHFL